VIAIDIDSMAVGKSSSGLRSRGRTPASSSIHADEFCQFFTDKVAKIRAACTDAAGPQRQCVRDLAPHPRQCPPTPSLTPYVSCSADDSIPDDCILKWPGLLILLHYSSLSCSILPLQGSVHHTGHEQVGYFFVAQFDMGRNTDILS